LTAHKETQNSQNALHNPQLANILRLCGLYFAFCRSKRYMFTENQDLTFLIDHSLGGHFAISEKKHEA